jgi:ABC-2 type transport system ATP-binding protein
VLSHEGAWWRVRVQFSPSAWLSVLWGEQLRRDWKILKIRSEASSLENLYLHHTSQERTDPQKATI